MYKRQDLPFTEGATGGAVTFDADFIESLTDFVACFFAADGLDFAAGFVAGLATALTGFTFAVFAAADFALVVFAPVAFPAAVFTVAGFAVVDLAIGLATGFFSTVVLLVTAFLTITGFLSTLTTFLG